MDIAKQRVQELLATANIRAELNLSNPRPWDIVVKDKKFFEEVALKKNLGMGESYEKGMWDCMRTEILYAKMIQAGLHKQSRSDLLNTISRTLFNLQDKFSAKQSVSRHYDLGNDLFTSMLDKNKIYSCGYWRNANTLEKAQEHKMRLICEKLGLKPGQHILDIGCGWGGLAKYMSLNYGVSITGITLSEEQIREAERTCYGLPIKILLQDYREVEGNFNHVVSVGMFEHVGHLNFKSYMTKIRTLLADDGLFLLHTIGSNTPGITTDKWIDKYIFPNSLIPSMSQITKAYEGLFVMEDVHNFGYDYYRTLMAWYQNFYQNFQDLQTIDPRYDNVFFRRWKHYLLSCAGSFLARHNNLWQIVLSKNGIDGGYISIR